MMEPSSSLQFHTSKRKLKTKIMLIISLLPPYQQSNSKKEKLCQLSTTLADSHFKDKLRRRDHSIFGRNEVFVCLERLFFYIVSVAI